MSDVEDARLKTKSVIGKIKMARERIGAEAESSGEDVSAGEREREREAK